MVIYSYNRERCMRMHITSFVCWVIYSFSDILSSTPFMFRVNILTVANKIYFVTLTMGQKKKRSLSLSLTITSHSTTASKDRSDSGYYDLCFPSLAFFASTLYWAYDEVVDKSIFGILVKPKPGHVPLFSPSTLHLF